MADLKVRYQQFFNEPGMKKDTFGLTYIEIMSTSSDYLRVPKNLIDTQVFSETLGGALPIFYQTTQAGGDAVVIDGGTVGNRYWIGTKHELIVNQGDTTP